MSFDMQEYLNTKHTLRFRKDGSFKILILTDSHGGSDMHPQLKAGMDAIITAAEPDLILLGGDQSGCHIGVHNPQELHDYLAQIMETAEKRGIPWAHVYGNHDFNLGVPNAEAQKVYEAFPWCVSKAGPEDIHGVGNFVLPVLHSDRDEPAYNVWGMDSHNDNKDFARAFGLPEDTQFILPEHFAMGYWSDSPYMDQLEWYWETSEGIEKGLGRKVPGMLLQHIPLPEFCHIPRNPQKTRMTGVMRETVGTNELNCGLFAACLQRGDIKSIFAGHDHLNDYCGTYCGITLGCCAGINYDAGCDDDLRGGRVVELREEDPWHAKTYMLRLREVMGPAADNRGRPEKQ